MKYKNTVTGEVIEVDASITGGFWEEVEENDEPVVGLGDGEPGDGEPESKKPKSRATRKGRSKRA